MARKSKTSAISARISEAEFEAITAYVDEHEINVADLIRVAIPEYMAKHTVTEE